MSNASSLPTLPPVSGFAVASEQDGCVSPRTPGFYQSDVFFIGGKYVGEPGKEFMQGAMYVEHLKPQTTDTSLGSKECSLSIQWLQCANTK
jgi:hypothetical protein